MDKLIAIAGRAGSGKTYAADYLVREHGFTRVKFADPLKNVYRKWLRNLDFNEIQIEKRVEGDLKEKHDPVFVSLVGKAAPGVDRALDVLPVKNTLDRYDQFCRQVVDDIHRNPHLCTPRRIMQRIGTEWGRDTQGATFWTDMWLATAMEYENVVCDDCRFDNEAKLVRQLNGTLIEVLGKPAPESEHVSEQINFEPDIRIRNTFDPLFLSLIEGCIDYG